MTDDQDAGRTGYRRPPVASRFVKGRSGNPRGRPRGRVRGIPHDAVLGRKVTIRDNGTERQVTAAEAFLLHLARAGLAGDGAAARSSLAAIEEARSARGDAEGSQIDRIVRCLVAPGNPNAALLRLRMARKLDRFRTTARVVLEPWLVEAALARLGDRRLTRAEQLTVIKATRTPHKVRWPHWWGRNDEST